MQDAQEHAHEKDVTQGKLVVHCKNLLHNFQVSKNLTPSSGEIRFLCDGVPVDGENLAAKYEGKEVIVTHV